MPEQTIDAAVKLRSYLPRLLIQWLADAPDDLSRAVDGSVVFVDISGFTAMSERLARHGKVGAEEVTEVLGGVFARLLAVAYGEGGGLLKFGGDALLLLFEGPGHERRAVTSAAGMRLMLRQIGAIKTTAGMVRLKMSVGVHSGEFLFFLVGSSHREFIIAGPSASRTVQMEGTAEGGEILLSPEIAAVMSRGVVGEPRGEGFLLQRAPGGAMGGQDAMVVDTGADLAVAVPVAIREYLRAGIVEPEHRRVTIAFIHYDGVDAIVEQEGPTALAAALQELVSDVQVAADRHGVTFLGTDVDHDGGKIILIAGAPRAIGDDEERMVLTLRQVVEKERTLPVRVGVNKGPVFVGDIGPAYRRTYTVMGDPVNLAARLMAKAKAGQIFATAGVLDASPVAFRTTPLEPFLVKGKKRPVEAFEVGLVMGTKHTEIGDDLPLVGRDTEVAAIGAALDDARRGTGRIVELVGPPGIGKSRLLGELRSNAGAFRVLEAACERYQASVAYRPFRTLLQEILGIVEGTPDAEMTERLRARVQADTPDLLPWVPLLGVPLDLDMQLTPEVRDLDEQFRKPRLEQVVDEFLAAVLPEPTVFAIEDVHWMDEVSRDLLLHLTRTAANRPWLVCVTRRDEDTGFVAPDQPGTVSLRPSVLSEEDASALLELASEDAPLRPDEIAMVAGRSGGNPLFLKELLSAARLAGGVDDLPNSVEALVTAQIDRLSASDRHLLRNAAVLGMNFTEANLSALLRFDDVDVVPAFWQRVGEFLVEDGPGEYRFRHALMRDAAYEGLPFRRRRELHARVGENLVREAGSEPEELSELLSLHFFHAERFQEAWVYSRKAGDRASAKYANGEAAMFYGRAIASAKRLGIDDREQAAVFEALGDVRWRVGAYAEAARAFRGARERLIGDAAGQAALLYKEARIPYRAGSYSQAIRWIRRGQKILEGVDGEEAAKSRAKLTVLYAAMRAAQGRMAEAVAWCQRSIELAEAAGERDALGRAYYVLDFAWAAQGRFDKVVNSDRAAAIYQELGDLGALAEVYNNSGASAYYQGRWDEAIDLYEKASDARRRSGDLVEAAEGFNNIGEIFSDQGRLEMAEGMFKDVYRVYRSAENIVGTAFALANLGRVATRGGRYDEATVLLEEARKLFAEAGDQGQVLETDARIAERHVFSGDTAVALAHVEATLKRAEASDIQVQAPLLHRLRGWGLVQHGDRAGARRAMDQSLSSAREIGADYEVALTLTALARLDHLEGRVQEEGLRAETRSIFERLGILSVPVVPIPASGETKGAR